jgi:AraC-like DNA-binding protein
MFHEHSSASGATRAHELELRTLWRVEADASYKVVRRESSSCRNFIALRTHRGTGFLKLTHGASFVLDAGSLIIVEHKKIESYHCVGAQWNFWWFEFQMYEPPHFVLEQSVKAKQVPNEIRECKELFSALKNLSLLERGLASARFTTLMYRWWVVSSNHWQQTPQRVLVERLIERMRARLTGWSVAEMAREMFLCEHRLRQIFKAQTGKSLKHFYDEMRLDAARQILEQGFVNVTEAAEQFGFSSPAHFCKAFRAHFGLPPSHIAAKSK